jgi:hypothetical protein
MSYQIEVAPHKESHQIELRNLLINWIICDNIPLNVVHSEAFCKLIKNLDPAFFIPDVKLIKQIIHKAYNHSINLIQEFLDNNSVSVNLTTDMWTGRNRQGFIGVTCSFLDKNFTLHEITLTIEYIRYPHTAQHISETLFAILDEWSLREKVYTIVTDNGANMKKAIKDMGLISSNIHWQPCTAHTLQLIIGKGLNIAKQLILRTKRLIDFFLRPKYSEKLEEIQKKSNLQIDIVRNFFFYFIIFII